MIDSSLNAEIVNMFSLSETKPKGSHNSISRDSLLDLFDSQFEEEKVLCVTGVEGVGVTTTLSMFAQRHNNCCASYFNNGWSRHLLNPQSIAFSLLRQLSWYTNSDLNYEVNTTSLAQCVYKLSRATKNKAKYLYFVFDGFNHLPVEYIDGIKNLLSPLFTIENIRFLFSGTSDEIKQILPDNLKVKQSNEILKFQLNDVQGFLKSTHPNLSDDEIGMVYDLSKKGLARQLTILHDIICDKGIDTIRDFYHNMIEDFYEDDFQWIENHENKNIRLIMALLAYSERPINRVAISSILKLTEQDTSRALSICCTYIEEIDDLLSLKSDDFRKYLRSKLLIYKNDIELLLIEWIEGSTDISEQFVYLPPLYKQAKGDKALVAYLTTEKVQHFLEEKKSQAALNEQCEYGYNACSDFESQAAAYFRFAINRSVSREIEKNELSDSELEALISIGDDEKAFALTQKVYLLEERLKCLLIIAQSSSHLSEGMSEEIEEQITTLSESIDYAHIPDKALELAKLMMPVKMEKALEIIDKVAKVTKDQSQIDRLYTAISLSYNKEGAEDNSAAKADIASTKIADKELRKMASVMKSIMKDSSALQVVSKMKELPPTSQLYFLSYWIPDHYDRDDIGDAVEYAVKLVIDTSSILMPKVTLLRSFCKPLPRMAEDKVKSVIELLDAVVSNIKFPTIEYVQLMILVICALSKHNSAQAGNRLQDLYLEILELKDTALQAHCKSFLLREYESLGKKEDIENWLSTAYSLQNEIQTDIIKVLENSAYHLKVVDGPIKALVCAAPTLIEQIIKKINTFERRSRAYLLAATEYVRQTDILKFDWKYFLKLFNQINYDKVELYKPIYDLVNKIIEVNGGNDDLFQNVKKYYNLFIKIEQTDIVCYFLSSLFSWATHNYSDSIFIDKISTDLYEAWDKISVPWLKVNTGYNIAKVLSKISMKVEARDYITKTASIRSNQLLSSLSCVTAYEQCLDLYTHSLGILIRSGLYDTNDLDQFKTLLSYDENEEDAIILWSQIALEFYVVGDMEKFSTIVSKYVSSDINRYSIDAQKRILYHISPSIYLTSPSLFYSRIEGFDKRFYNACINNVARFLQTKYPYPEYVSSNEVETQIPLAQPDYDKLLDLIEHSEDEEFVFTIIDTITNTIEQNVGRSLSRELQRVIFTKLDTIVKKILPMRGGIQHDGYLLSCCAMIDGRKPGGNIDTDKIQERIEAIPNIADQAFLYAHISGCLKKASEKARFIDESIAKTEAIDYIFDKYNRYSICVQESFQSAKAKAKSVALNVMNSLKSENNGSYSDYQRILDLVRDNDEQLADSMLEMMDDDPARMQYKRKLRLRMQSRKKLEAAKKDLYQLDRLNPDEQVRFFARQMESLIKKKNVIRDINSTQSIIRTIYENPITDTQNAILYFLENLYQKNSSNGKYKALLKEMHRAIRYTLKLVLAIASGTKEKLDRVNRILEERSDSNESMIYVGESIKGFERIIDWYKSHPSNTLRIIDPYFHAEDLFIIKSLMDINNDLNCSILTNNDKTESINDIFQKGWNKLSDEITGRIEIRSCCYEDDVKKCPWHDRWWLLYDDDNDQYHGIRMASPSTIGIRISEISEMEDEAIKSANMIFNRFFINMAPKNEGRKLLYQETKLR